MVKMTHAYMLCPTCHNDMPCHNDTEHKFETQGVLVPLLLDADDLVLISRSLNGLQAQLNILQQFCASSGLEVNLDKTECVMFGYHPRASTLNCTYQGGTLKTSDTFKYLGLRLHGRHGKVGVAADDLIKASTAAYYALADRCNKLNILNPAFREQLFDTLVSPVITYATEFWIPYASTTTFDKLDALHRKWLKSSLHVAKSTCNDIILAEFGRMPLGLTALKLAVRYYVRLQNLDEGRLVKLALRECYDLERTGTAIWLGRLESWTHSVGYAGQYGGNLDPEQVMSCACSQYVSQWTSRALAAHGRKLGLYSEIKTNFDQEQYLTDRRICEPLRVILARFRTGSHCLRSRTAIFDGKFPNATCKCHYDNGVVLMPLSQRLRVSQRAHKC